MKKWGKVIGSLIALTMFGVCDAQMAQANFLWWQIALYDAGMGVGSFIVYLQYKWRDADREAIKETEGSYDA